MTPDEEFLRAFKIRPDPDICERSTDDEGIPVAITQWEQFLKLRRELTDLEYSRDTWRFRFWLAVVLSAGFTFMRAMGWL